MTARVTNDEFWFNEQKIVMGQFVMKYSMPPLTWLRAFEAAARHLSFTHAARDLGLSQVAVSKQVKQLELKLREQLFVRHARSLELTKVGEAYLPKVRDAFERLSDGTQEVFGERHSDILTIRSVVGFSVNWLAPRLPDFHAKHPNIALRIVSSVWNEEVGNPNFDLDIRYGTGNWSGLRADRLTWDTISPVCAPSLIEQKKIERIEDLANHNLIHVLGYEEGWAKWLRATNCEKSVDTGRGTQVDNSLLAFQMAANGNGIALARSSLSEGDIAKGSLTLPFDLQVPIEEAFYLVSRTVQRNERNAEKFRNWLLSVATQ